MARESLRQVWDKFFWSDWRSDEALAISSFAARGLWMELLALMAKAEPRGFLLVNGQMPDDATLQVLVRASSRSEMRRLIKELVSKGVCSQTAEGVLFSRRMVRKAQESERAFRNGSKGGNPNLKKRAQVAQSVNHDDNLLPNRPSNTQKLEARSQKDQEQAAPPPMRPVDDVKSHLRAAVWRLLEQGAPYIEPRSGQIILAELIAEVKLIAARDLDAQWSRSPQVAKVVDEVVAQYERRRRSA